MVTHFVRASTSTGKSGDRRKIQRRLPSIPLSLAKNLVLAGVKSVTLHDEENVEMWDLSSNFFLSEEDIGKNRAHACILKLQELNNVILVSSLSGPLTKEQLSNFQKQPCVEGPDADFLEEQKAYFMEVDAFELPVEFVEEKDLE